MKRRFQAYCVSTGVSGTNSMAGIFSSHYRAAHEPHSKELFTIIYALLKGVISEQDFRRYSLHLDHKLQLEFNSSFLNNWQLNVFVPEFPDAKFIFTIRDCYSWLNSIVGRFVFSPYKVIPKENQRFRDEIFGKGVYKHAKEEKVLYENGLYTLDGFLSYWAKSNNEILSTVPQARILTIKTDEINNRISDIADFLEISPKTLDFTKSHMNKSVKYSNLLSQIDRDYLASKVDLHCRSLMDRFFPGHVHTFE